MTLLDLRNRGEAEKRRDEDEEEEAQEQGGEFAAVAVADVLLRNLVPDVDDQDLQEGCCPRRKTLLHITPLRPQNESEGEQARQGQEQQVLGGSEVDAKEDEVEIPHVEDVMHDDGRRPVGGRWCVSRGIGRRFGPMCHRCEERREEGVHRATAASGRRPAMNHSSRARKLTKDPSRDTTKGMRCISRISSAKSTAPSMRAMRTIIPPRTAAMKTPVAFPVDQQTRKKAPTVLSPARTAPNATAEKAVSERPQRAPSRQPTTRVATRAE